MISQNSSTDFEAVSAPRNTISAASRGRRILRSVSMRTTPLELVVESSPWDSYRTDGTLHFEGFPFQTHRPQSIIDGSVRHGSTTTSITNQPTASAHLSRSSLVPSAAPATRARNGSGTETQYLTGREQIATVSIASQASTMAFESNFSDF